jgi:hypothetical protein
MMDVYLKVTTNGSGAGSASHTSSVTGWLVGFDYEPGTLDTGATITISDVTPTATMTIYTKASAGTTNVRKYPRTLEQLDTDGSNLGTYTFPLLVGVPKFTVASGGAAAHGALRLYILPLDE